MGLPRGDFCFLNTFCIVRPVVRLFPDDFLICHARSTRWTHLSTSWNLWRQLFRTKSLSVRNSGPTRTKTHRFMLGSKINAMKMLTLGPLTFIGRCQALGRVGRCQPYAAWALLHVSMWYGLRFYVGSPYYLRPASAHSAT